MYVLLKQEVRWVQPLRSISCPFVVTPQMLWLLNYQNLRFMARIFSNGYYNKMHSYIAITIVMKQGVLWVQSLMK